MAAEKGSQWWKLRAKHGRDKLFETPELLWESACEYFQRCDNEPWIRTKETYNSEKGSTTEEIPTSRPYSKSGLFLYIGCSDNWLREFKKTCDDNFLRVIEEIENIIYTQQFEGATVGAFNANIIARSLGLKEQIDQTTKGKEINQQQSLPIETINKLIDKL